MREIKPQIESNPFYREEVHVAPTTTFEKLGIEDSREKRLSLDGEPVSVMAIKNDQGKNWTYSAFFDHSFVGSHLGHFLNVIAPFKINPSWNAKLAILADFNMAKEAKDPTYLDLDYREYVRLDRLHEGDPTVGPIYREFVDQGFRQETEALKTSQYNSIFDQVFRLGFVNSQKVEEIISQLVARFRLELKEGRQADAFSDIGYAFVYSHILQTEFLQFIGIQHNTQQFQDIWWRFKSMKHSDYLKQASLILSFLEQLSPEVQRRALLERSNIGGFSLIDLKKREIFDIDKDIKPSFLSDHSFQLSDNNGISIQLEIQPDSDDIYLPYQVTRYNFPPEPLQNALYPVIAWRRDNQGKRRFISQKELLQYFPLPSIDPRKQPDVYLGRALLAYFSENLTRNWQSIIPLKGGRRPQLMMVGQMAAWPSIDSEEYPHARQLLGGEAIQKLEEHSLVT